MGMVGAGTNHHPRALWELCLAAVALKESIIKIHAVWYIKKQTVNAEGENKNRKSKSITNILKK